MALIPRGAPIAVVAPSGSWNEERYHAGLDLARAAGHHLVEIDVRPHHRYLAGTDEARRRALVEALTGDYAAVWALRGGYGVTRLMPDLPWDRFGSARPVLGFSDLTALFSGMYARGAGPCVHGPVVHSLSITDEASREHLWRLLDGQPVEPLRGETWIDGKAAGPLVGGNLTLLASTAGTPWQLSARGAVLVLEDVGEAAYRIDRALQQLASTGVLSGVAAVAVGALVDCRVPGGATWTMKDVVLDHLGRLGVPVLGQLPIGHGPGNRAFVWGRVARVEDGALFLE